MIIAGVAGNAEYDEGRLEQSFTVAKDPSERITFTSAAPKDATVGGSYTPSVRSSAGLTVMFSNATPSVCKIVLGLNGSSHVSLIAPGTCTLDVRQVGASAQEPPEAQQSFKVSVTKAQKLAGALRTCQKDKAKSKRKACEANAKKRRGTTTSQRPPPACVPVEGGVLAGQGHTVEVRVGEAVQVGLVEPEAYTARDFPGGFPWSSPQSSDTRVLSAAPFCPHRIEGSSLPERSAGFRAEHPGTAEIRAPLVTPWQTLNPDAYGETTERRTRLEPLEAFRATVIVLPR